MKTRCLATAFCSSLLVFAACSRPPSLAPIATQADVQSYGGVLPVRAPLHIHDARFQAFTLNPDGTGTLVTYDTELFPVDLFVIISEGSNQLEVFLQRSPHGGCLLHWEPGQPAFQDPCYGSKFDMQGKLISGPSPRDMDRLPATIQQGIVFVAPEISYGEPTR